mmetsp:Transcript_74662/g.242619  ORF Transcript_74662/g.242619 Transcript_74662/m.242619 type:complete len:86 (-) Transcript_74662:88-345(-)
MQSANERPNKDGCSKERMDASSLIFTVAWSFVFTGKGRRNAYLAIVLFSANIPRGGPIAGFVVAVVRNKSCDQLGAVVACCAHVT